jgi:hypothetical protein
MKTEYAEQNITEQNIDVLYELTKLPTDTGSHPQKMETSTVPMRKPKNSHKEI